MVRSETVIGLLGNRSVLLISVVFLVLVLSLLKILRSQQIELATEINRVTQQRNLLLREQSLYAEYAPRFETLVVSGDNPAVKRLGWQASVREIVKLHNGQLSLFVLDAQRQLSGESSVTGYQFNETGAEVELSAESEVTVLQMVGALSRLSRYATDLRSCSMSTEPVAVLHLELARPSPVRLACQFNLYEISRS